MKKNSLSIIILADTNDVVLKRALQSSRWAQEVLVVTTTTGDWSTLPSFVKQRAYPESKSAQFHFSEVRNWALQQAAGEWVLFLDSDEVLPISAEKSITDIPTPSNLGGVYLRRQDIFLGKPLRFGETGSTYLLRLMRKSAAHFSGAVHETAEVEGDVVFVPITLSHFAHKSVASFIQKVTKYAELVAQERYVAGKKFQIVELLCFPIGKFLWNYVILWGFLDGWRGLIYASVMSLHSASVRIFLYELNQKNAAA